MHLQKLFSSQWSPSEPIILSFEGRDFDQKFITGGFRVKLWKSFELSTSFLDSHLFPNKKIEKDLGKDAKQFHQTYIASGIRISL